MNELYKSVGYLMNAACLLEGTDDDCETPMAA
jgi:hypothetical protein